MLQQETKVWTIREIMRVALDLFQKKGIEEPRLNVELLLAHALKCQRIQLYTSFDKPLTREETSEFRRYLERRLNREPLQYIVGAAGFMGLQFRVDQRVLIPRPETETLVEQVMLLCNGHREKKNISVLDVGTGSGNIAIALAKYVKNLHVTGIDVNQETLDVAGLNAKVHEVGDRVEFHMMDIFEPVDQILLKHFDFVVSNPPYISLDDFEHLQQEVRRYEPRTATTDGRDGFEYYRRLAEIVPYLLVEGGALAVEVGYAQAERVRTLLEDAGFYHLYVVPDLQSVPRVVIGFCHATTRNPGPVN